MKKKDTKPTTSFKKKPQKQEPVKLSKLEEDVKKFNPDFVDWVRSKKKSKTGATE